MTNERDWPLRIYSSRERKEPKSLWTRLHDLVPVTSLTSLPSTSPLLISLWPLWPSHCSLNIPDTVASGSLHWLCHLLVHPSPDTLMAHFLASLKSMFRHHLRCKTCLKPLMWTYNSVLIPELLITLTLPFYSLAFFAFYHAMYISYCL